VSLEKWWEKPSLEEALPQQCCATISEITPNELVIIGDHRLMHWG